MNDPHPIGVPCPTCTKPGRPFAAVHVPGPPCLACGNGWTRDDGGDVWRCPSCGATSEKDERP